MAMLGAILLKKKNIILFFFNNITPSIAIAKLSRLKDCNCNASTAALKDCRRMDQPIFAECNAFGRPGACNA